MGGGPFGIDQNPPLGYGESSSSSSSSSCSSNLDRMFPIETDLDNPKPTGSEGGVGGDGDNDPALCAEDDADDEDGAKGTGVLSVLPLCLSTGGAEIVCSACERVPGGPSGAAEAASFPPCSVATSPIAALIAAKSNPAPGGM